MNLHIEIHLNRFFLDENSTTYQFLQRANDTSEWICKFYIKYETYIVVGGNITIANINVLIGLLKEPFDVSQAFHISRF